MIANGEEKISRKGAKAQRSSLSNQCLFFFSVPLCVCVRSFLLLLLIQGFLVSANSTAAADRPLVLVVVGAEGDKEFAEPFRQWAGRWEEAAKAAPADFFAIGLEEPGEVSDRDLLKSQIEKAAGPSAEAFWLVLIGHGTYDGKLARFNLRGADISPTELVGWLKPVERPLAVIDCTSASGPFLNELSGTNRVVVTSTRSGSEYNYSRFGDYISAAIVDKDADLDKDEQTSLLEAFLKAAAGVKEFYAGEGRLATEHSLLDDNGDSLGTPADWFQGLRATKVAKDGAALDGLLAGQMVLVRSQRDQQLPPTVRVRRDELERQLAALRQKKSKLSEAEYLTLIEPVLIELARLYEGTR